MTSIPKEDLPVLCPYVLWRRGKALSWLRGLAYCLRLPTRMLWGSREALGSGPSTDTSLVVLLLSEFPRAEWDSQDGDPRPFQG